MKSIRLPLSILAALAAAGSPAPAGEPPSGEDRILSLERFIGEWTIEANWSSGDPLKARAVYEWGVGKKIIKARTYVGAAEKEYLRYESVMAWHAQKESLFEISFAFDGSVSEYRIDAADADTLRLGWSPFREGGEPGLRQTIRFRGKEEHEWQVEQKRGEEWKTLIRGTWKRKGTEQVSSAGPASTGTPESRRRFLYVATPGIRDYLEYGGHGILVFDIDQGHRFVKRIPFGGVDETGKPLNVKGICANASTGRIYVSTIRTLSCLDLVSEKVLWEKAYPGGCDRMSMSPDGRVIYLPSLEKEHWHVVDAGSGEVLRKIVTNSGAHNTLLSRDGRYAFLAGLRSPHLTIADARTHEEARKAGPFSASIRPFTINGKGTRCFVNVNDLLGFEVGDLESGKVLHRVQVEGFEKGPVKRHGCPSHGIGLTLDEKEIWLTDAANQRLHIFDVTAAPPRQVASVTLRDQPGWITFGLDGRLAYPSTGDVVEVATRKVIAALTDEKGVAVQSEKMLEIDFRDGRPSLAGDQFGVGGVR